MFKKRKRIQIRESEIPNIEIRVLTNDFRPIGDYSLPNLLKKYWSR